MKVGPRHRAFATTYRYAAYLIARPLAGLEEMQPLDANGSFDVISRCNGSVRVEAAGDECSPV